MQDRPTATELLEAIRHFVESDLVPELEGTKKFHARVAANLLSILHREWQQEDELGREWASLGALLGENEPAPTHRRELREQLRARTERLCERIRAGDADHGEWRRDVVEHVRATVVDKLAVANPKYLAASRDTD